VAALLLGRGHSLIQLFFHTKLVLATEIFRCNLPTDVGWMLDAMQLTSLTRVQGKTNWVPHMAVQAKKSITCCL
jgi:hypothetical protein